MQLDGEELITSVNVEFELESNQAAIKNYSENVGVLDALIAAGIVQDTGVRLPIGYTYANLCELLVESA